MAEHADQHVVLADNLEALPTKASQGAERRRYWKEHIKRWQASGMTQKDYCQRNGLKWSTFHYWRKRAQEPSVPVSLVHPHWPVMCDKRHVFLCVVCLGSWDPGALDGNEFSEVGSVFRQWPAPVLCEILASGALPFSSTQE